jgi:hypothetical protein
MLSEAYGPRAKRLMGLTPNHAPGAKVGDVLHACLARHLGRPRLAQRDPVQRALAGSLALTIPALGDSGFLLQPKLA